MGFGRALLAALAAALAALALAGAATWLLSPARAWLRPAAHLPAAARSGPSPQPLPAASPPPATYFVYGDANGEPFGGALALANSTVALPNASASGWLSGYVELGGTVYLVSGSYLAKPRGSGYDIVAGGEALAVGSTSSAAALGAAYEICRFSVVAYVSGSPVELFGTFEGLANCSGAPLQVSGHVGVVQVEQAALPAVVRAPPHAWQPLR